MNADGISYLDRAGRAAEFGPGELVNAYWSPLYPALLAAMLRLFAPPAAWLFPLAQLANWLTLVLTLAGFTYLVSALWPRREAGYEYGMAFCYAAFLWSALTMTRPYRIEPDYLLWAAIYLAAGLLLRAEREPGRLSYWILFGAALALGYLAKFVLWPLSIALLALVAAAWRRHPPRMVAAAAVGFAVTAGPWVYVLSRDQGSFTPGEAGALNRAWITAEDAATFDTTGTWIKDSADGVRKLHDKPLAIGYGHSPLPGTYPLWYDPAYWHSRQGTRPKSKILPAVLEPGMLGENLKRLYAVLGGHWALAGGLLALVLLRSRTQELAQLVLDHYWLVAWPAAAIAGYSGTVMESRYVAPFAMLLLLVCGCAMRQARWALLVAALFWAWAPLREFPGNLRLMLRSLRVSSMEAENLHWEAARQAQALGLQPGFAVASIGSPFQAFFLKPAGLRVVAEVPQSHVEGYCRLGAPERKVVRDALLSGGAVAIIAAESVGCFEEPEWRTIEPSRFRVLLPPAAPKLNPDGAAPVP